MRSILLVLVMAGCYPDGPGEVHVALNSFSMLHISATDRSLDIVLGLRDPIDQAGPCPIVDANLTARLGDVPVLLVTRGGKIGEDPGDDVADNLCGTVTLRRPGLPPDGAAVLELSDPTSTVACRVPDLKAARTLMQVPPESGTWQWQSGQAVTVQMSSGADLSRWTEFSLDLVQVVDGMLNGRTSISDAMVDGDLLHFTVPSVAPGPYALVLSPSRYVNCNEHPAIADVSSTFTDFTPHHAVTIVP